MKTTCTYLFLLLFLSLLHCHVSGQMFDTQWLRNNGPSSEKVDIAILGDGYTASEQQKFITDATTAINGMFNMVPFSTLATDFNVKAVKVISNSSGAAINQNELIDNYFGSTFGYGGIDRLLVPTKNYRVIEVINSDYPEADVIVIMVNTEKYGGSGGNYCTFSTHAETIDLLVHEFGHTFANLRDEYWAGNMYAREGANMTQNNDPSSIKWKQFLDQEGVGIYRYTPLVDWYRPHQNCEMRRLGNPFCLVCNHHIEQVTNDITSGGSGVVPSVPKGLTAKYITATSFRLLWEASTDATSYMVQKWSNDAWTEVGTTENTYLKLSGLTSGSMLYLRVKAMNEANSSAFSKHKIVQLKTSAGSAPSVPTNLVAVNVTANSFTAQWNASPGATSYNVQKSSDGGTWTEAGTTENTYLDLSGFTSGSEQYVRVKAINEVGSSVYSSHLTVQLKTNPGTTPSVPTSLVAANVTANSFTAQWNASPGATSYNVQIWSYGAWTEAGTTENTYLDLSGFASGSEQYVRVKAINEAGSSVYSNHIIVQLKTSPGSVPSVPTNLAFDNVSANSFTIKWNASPGTTSYNVQTWSNGTLKNAGSTSDTTLNISGIPAGITQYIRVNASNEFGSSNYSSWKSVNIPNSPPLMGSNANMVYIYPNPAFENIRINFNGDYGTVEFYTSQGVLVKKTELYESREINISALAEGVYVVYIKTEGELIKTKLLIKR